MVKTVAILTPAYNRADRLSILFSSLNNQISKDFKWYIIDDGSKDNTKEVVESFQPNGFEIEYLFKPNGGKHTALNVGVERIEEELTFIVDSDDYLTEDAVSTIVADWQEYKNTGIVGISYYRINAEGRVIGDRYPIEPLVIDTFVNMRINQNVMGDKAEVYLTSTLKNYPFPVYDGERFLSEAIVWNAISNGGGKLAFIAKGIYVCEYLEGGLTMAGKKKMADNPLGYLEHCRAYMYPCVKSKIKWKYTLLYVVCAILAKRKYREKLKKTFQACPCKGKYIFTFPFGVALYLLWGKKFN